MLVRIALVMLVAWLVFVVGPFEVGPLVHGLLLVGLMLFLLGALKARDSARTPGANTNDSSRPH